MDKILDEVIESGDQELVLALILRLLGEYLNAPDTQIGVISQSQYDDLSKTRAYADAMAKQYRSSGLDMSDLADKATAKSSQIKKNRQITKKPFVLFLCQQPDSQNLRRLQQIVLIALNQHFLQFGPTERLKQAMASFRLLCNNHRSAPSDQSPDQNGKSIFIGIKEAKEQLQLLVQTSSESLQRYSQSIHRIVADVIDGELGNPRTIHHDQQGDEQETDKKKIGSPPGNKNIEGR